MEDAVEPQGWLVDVESVTLPDGSDFETDDIAVGTLTLDEAIEEKAIESYGE